MSKPLNLYSHGVGGKQRMLPPDKYRLRELRAQGVPSRTADRMAHAEQLQAALRQAKSIGDLWPILNDMVLEYSKDHR